MSHLGHNQQQSSQDYTNPHDQPTTSSHSPGHNQQESFSGLHPGGGGLPYKKGGDARWEISNEPLKGTSLGVA